MAELPSVVGQDTIAELVAAAQSVPDGCFVEVGVFKGGTAQHLERIAKLQNRELYLYDTFTGIPFADPIDCHKVGDFGDASYEAVRDALPWAKVIKGIFPESAVPMPSVSFAHIDCDQYRSVRDCIRYLMPLMAKGGVMWFDDYCLEGAKKAIDESFSEIKTTVTHKVYIVA